MYAADHIRRVLTTFPGVFSGIGEFTIHKEFVSSKIAGETASLLNPALDRMLDFAGEVGLVAILHNDIDMPFPKPGQDPYQVEQMRDLVKRHPKATIIWAHAGLGRVVRPVKDQLDDHGTRARRTRRLKNVYIDISWDEVAKYVVASARGASRRPQTCINAVSGSLPVRHRRSRAARPAEISEGLRHVRAALAALPPEVREKFRKGNYERLFDEATPEGAGVGKGQRGVAASVVEWCWSRGR